MVFGILPPPSPTQVVTTKSNKPTKVVCQSLRRKDERCRQQNEIRRSLVVSLLEYCGSIIIQRRGYLLLAAVDEVLYF